MTIRRNQDGVDQLATFIVSEQDRKRDLDARDGSRRLLKRMLLTGQHNITDEIIFEARLVACR